MTATGKTLLAVGSALTVTAANLMVTAVPSIADQVVLHHVKYTLTADHPIYTDIYYLGEEPPVFSDYSHNPYQFVPNVKVDVSPDAPWSHELDLAKPNEWAFFTASAGTEPGTPMYHCKLLVDGAVVVSNDGPRGVLCSIRQW